MSIIGIVKGGMAVGFAFAKANSPVLAIAAGAVGLAATIVEAIRATPGYIEDTKKEEKIVEAAIEKGVIEDVQNECADEASDNGNAKPRPRTKLSKWTVAKLIAKNYWKTILGAMITLFLFILAQRITAARLMAASAALVGSQQEAREQLAKADELFGEGSGDKIKKQMEVDRLNAQYNYFRDCQSMQTFEGTIGAVQAGVNSVNAEAIRLHEENSYNSKCLVCANDLYDEWGIQHTAAGYMIGTDLMEHGPIEVTFKPAHFMHNGRHVDGMDIVYEMHPIDEEDWRGL